MAAVAGGGEAQRPSAAWHRVAALQPRLRSHVRVHRHEYRGERWYVVEDRLSRRTHRFDASAYVVLGLMDGRRSLQQIWEAAQARLGEHAPTQDDLIQLLAQLHAADILQSEVTPDVDELLRRSHRIARKSLLGKVASPLAIRIPLFDPDRLLERLAPWYRPLLGATGAAVWLVVVGWASVAAFQHWDLLTQDLTDRALAPQNLLILGVVFPLLKALHEFGHACAVKAWGGEVHEMGIMLLVLMPVPYVDASAANAFAQKRRRVLVGAAGMAVELFAASVALMLWLQMEPGVPRAVLFNVMLIAGVSTLIFNANPLLRFDGYYILADLIEMPNLRTRAQAYLASLFQRLAFGLEVPAPPASVHERAWLAFFAIASWIYRLVVVFGIALFIGTQYFIVGVLLALWAVASAVVWPVVGLVGYLALSPRLRRHRARAALSTGLIAAVIAGVVFLVPLPSWTNAQGVIALPDQLALRGGTDGFVVRLLAEPGSGVRKGQPLVEAADWMLPLRIRQLEGQRDELEARLQAESFEQRVRAQITTERLKAVEADLARERERARDLVVLSPADGVFALAAAPDLPGRFVKRGEQIGYVVPRAAPIARVVVPQQAVDLVRTHTERVRVMLAERVGETIEARVLRELPQASSRLPSLALAQSGGGDVALDPQGGAQARALQTHFEFELEVPVEGWTGLGGRVHVRFEHGNETIAVQTWRWLRQLFLRRFAV